MENWYPKKEEIDKLRQFSCSDVRGYKAFKEQRSNIMKIAYSCLRHTNRTFGECQIMAWDIFDNLSCENGGSNDGRKRKIKL